MKTVKTTAEINPDIAREILNDFTTYTQYGTASKREKKQFKTMLTKVLSGHPGRYWVSVSKNKLFASVDNIIYVIDYPTAYYIADNDRDEQDEVYYIFRD